MPGSGNNPCIRAFGDDTRERFDGPCVVRLKTELMDRHAAHSGAGVVEHALDQGPHDIDGERANFASLASDRMDGMPSDQRRGIAQSVLE